MERVQVPAETQVLIVGAGPVGLTLALDLGRRGVRCLLIDKSEQPIRLPKMERCNARTMEIYRRLGIADQVRAAGLPADAPMDVFLAPSLADPPIHHLAYPSVAQAKADIAARNDGTRTLEPYQVISQYTLEPLLRSIVRQVPCVTASFGVELVSFQQDERGVSATLADSSGQERTIRADYLAGCDGGSSTVRHQLGFQLEGQAAIRKLRQALFRCDGLYQRIPMGKGRHYHVADAPLFPFFILQDSTRHWTLHAAAATDAEMADVFAKAIGFPIEFEMLSVNEWTQHLLCADRYQDGRVFIAGDAAHLMIPTGGLGMNTGVGDAIDLGWKLAATLAGWGGRGLLDAYQAERRPIGLRNVRASGAGMSGRLVWRGAFKPDVRDQTPEGARTRAEMAAAFDVEQRKVTEILGIEAGYRYLGSPIVCAEPGDGPDPDNVRYMPTTWPGARLPHAWLEDGSALHDRLGPWFTLLDLSRGAQDVAPFQQAFRELGAPLEVAPIADAIPRDLYERDLLLLRPDLHVAWRGNAVPDNPAAVARLVTGNSPPVRLPGVPEPRIPTGFWGRTG